MHGDGVPTRVTLVGDGEERSRLTRLASELNLDSRITFTGYVPHEKMAQLYANATVLVHPARAATHFGIPNVVVEAQAASLPVVCTPLPALPELIEDGTSGLYVDEDDADGLARTLRSLFADPAWRRRLATEGLRRVAARFDITETAATLASLFATPGRRKVPETAGSAKLQEAAGVIPSSFPDRGLAVTSGACLPPRSTRRGGWRQADDRARRLGCSATTGSTTNSTDPASLLRPSASRCSICGTKATGSCP